MDFFLNKCPPLITTLTLHLNYHMNLHTNDDYPVLHLYIFPN